MYCVNLQLFFIKITETGHGKNFTPRLVPVACFPRKFGKISGCQLRFLKKKSLEKEVCSRSVQPLNLNGR
jgi:hypothetical protein